MVCVLSRANGGTPSSRRDANGLAGRDHFGGKQILVLGMASHKRAHERALGHHFNPPAADVLENAAHKLDADVATTQRQRDFGVEYGDGAGQRSVVGDGTAGLGFKLVAVERGIIANGLHGAATSLRSWRERRSLVKRHLPHSVAHHLVARDRGCQWLCNPWWVGSLRAFNSRLAPSGNGIARACRPFPLAGPPLAKGLI